MDDFSTSALEMMLGRAKQLLRSSRYAALRRVNCDLVDGMLILRGTVKTYFDKQMAQEAILQAIAPLLGMENLLEVQSDARLFGPMFSSEWTVPDDLSDSRLDRSPEANEGR